MAAYRMASGKFSPDIILLSQDLRLSPTRDDLKALCAAFGTTSGAPMLHILGQTPEAREQMLQKLPTKQIESANLREAWFDLNRGMEQIDLVAIGSPHASLGEIRKISSLMAGRKCHAGTQVKITAARHTLQRAKTEGSMTILEHAGVQLLPDLCWCSIIEPIFPPEAKGVMTNSGKYAHYAHGLSKRHARLGSLQDCVEAATTGFVARTPPSWLMDAED